MLTGRTEISIPCFRLVRGQLNPIENFGQITAFADTFSVRYQARHRSTITKQNERHILVMRAIHTVRKVTGGFSNGNYGLLHKNQIIRLRSENKTLALRKQTSNDVCRTASPAADYYLLRAAVSLVPISGTVRPTTAAICRTCSISESN